MDCKDIERLLSSKPFAELSPQERSDAATHVAGCSACRAKWHIDFGTQELQGLVQSLSSEKSVKGAVMDRIKGEGGASEDSSDKEEQLGATIGGFEIIGRIGRGGMGTVFKARQTSMDRIVAVKVLSPRLAKDEDFVQRFLREARSTARLNHPNIVQAIDAGLADGYYYYLAMEYVDGVTVRQLMTKEGQIAEVKALRIIAGVARALEHAHKHGIVHRDIKPENIMINREGVVKLADLGLARSYAKPDTLTMHGTALGTPYYMSPEQARGEEEIDTRSDIYALGATLYHMLTGEFPFDGPTPAVILAKHLTEPVPTAKAKNHAVTSEVCDLIRRMMAKKKELRPQTPTSLLHFIQQVLERSTVTPPAMAAAADASRTEAQDRTANRLAARRRKRRMSAASWVVTILLILAGNGILYWWWSGYREGKQLSKAGDEYYTALSSYKEAPDDLDGASSRFRSIITKYPETEFAEKAKGELTRVEQARSAQTQTPTPVSPTEEVAEPKTETTKPEEAAFQAAKAHLSDVLSKRGVKAAAEVLARVASEGNVSAKRMAELRSDLLAAATTAVEQLDKRADPLVDQEKFDEAAKVYQEPLTWGVSEIEPLIQERVARIEGARTAAQEAAKAEAQTKFLAAFDQQVKPLIAERRYKEASDALELLAKKEEMKAAEAEAKVYRADIARLLSFRQGVEKQLSALQPGQKIRVKGMLVPDQACFS